MALVFQTVFKMSLSASVLVAAILLVRPLFRKAPKWILCALWALVAVRLLCPFSVETPLSLVPDPEPVVQSILSVEPTPQTGTIYPSGELTVHIVPDIIPPYFVFRFWMVWITGAAVIFLYMLVSYITVRRRVRIWEELSPRVRRCDEINTPFILGLLSPKIYLPSRLPEESRDYVIAHEQAHLQRKDHWWKPLGFLLLCVHWFNPVLWLAYIFLCRDIEFACDEKVVRNMKPEEKQAYSEALLQNSVRQRFITACPLAFGEVGVKARIKSVLHYKKPAFWIVLIAFMAGIALAVFFLTDRPETESGNQGNAVEITQHLEGKVISQNGNYIKVRVDSSDSVMMVYVNISGFPELPQLKAGDIVMVHYKPSENPAQLDDVTEIRRTQLADWGVSMQVTDVTPTGLQLWTSVISGFPRTLATTEAYYLEQNINGQWQKVNGINENAFVFSEESISYADGNNVMLNWENRFGALTPSQYRLCKMIRYQDEERVFSVEFTIAQPMATSLEDAINQTVRYILSKQMINPTKFTDKTIEHIPQNEQTGFLDDPSTSEPVGKTFEQITESHLIIDHQQNGNIHTLSILGLCRGYNHRVQEDEFFSPMLLVIEETQDGTYTATSCKMPTQLYWQADIEWLFPADIASQMLNSKINRHSLAAACDKQVTGGAIQLNGFGSTFEPESTEGKLILQAIANGKKLKKAYEDGFVCTIYIGDKVYYYYKRAGIIHNVTDNVYTQLTEESRSTLRTILDLVQ